MFGNNESQSPSLEFHFGHFRNYLQHLTMGITSQKTTLGKYEVERTSVCSLECCALDMLQLLCMCIHSRHNQASFKKKSVTCWGERISRPYPWLGAMAHWWLLKKGKSLFFGSMATSRVPTPRWMMAYPYKSI